MPSLPAVRSAVVALFVLVLAGLVVAVVRTPLPSAYAADPPLTPVRWICYLDEEGDIVTEDKERAIVKDEATGLWVLVEDRHLCTSTSPVKDRPLPSVDIDWIKEVHPELDLFQREQALEELGMIQCGKRGATLAPATAGSLPTAKDMKQACSVKVPAGIADTAGGVMDGGAMGGGLMTRPGAGMPSPDSIECGGSVANPYADGNGTAPSNGDLLWQMTKDFLGGVTITSGIIKGVGAGAGAPLAVLGGTAAFEDWGRGVAAALGTNMEDRYRASAQDLADGAAAQAAAATSAAQAAAASAPGSASAATAAEEAAKANAAADAAAKAAAEAKAAKDRAAIGAAQRAALKAAEDAKKAADAAKKAAEEAKNNPQPAPSSSPNGGGTKNPSGSDSAREACEELRQQLWECEQNGWKSFECEELANKLSGCQIDMTVALVAEDGQVCGKPYVDADTVQAAIDHACGLEIARYGPDMNPCSVLVDGVSGSFHEGGCDPTVAYGGCPSPETGGELPDDGVLCFPSPPNTPPVPCVDTNGGGPVVGFIVDGAGTLYVDTPGGLMAVGNVDPEADPFWVNR